MTATRIRIGRVAIEGMTQRPSADALGSRLQAAIGAALSQSSAARLRAISLPSLRVTLHHGATEADVAAAVANALRDALGSTR